MVVFANDDIGKAREILGQMLSVMGHVKIDENGNAVIPTCNINQMVKLIRENEQVLTQGKLVLSQVDFDSAIRREK